MKRFLICMVAIVSIFLVTACGSKNDLIGTWEGKTTDGLKTTMTFKDKDKFEYKNEFGFESTGTYKVKDDIVTLSLKEWDKDKEYKFEIKDKKLSLTAQDKYSPNYKDLEKK